MKLTEQEKQRIIKLIKEGKPIPSHYKSKLFSNDDVEYIEATKDYKLVYKGKARKEKIIAQTPAAPFQKIRSFNSDNSFDDGWSNMLVFGDNLMALKTIYEDQQGENRLKTKNKIKLIYIDPPFATKQDFMKDREKAYRDKIIGARFIEFLRTRLILLREILADDGSIYVHLDEKKGHYVKCMMDEVFGEHNFRNEIIWHYGLGGSSDKKWAQKIDMILFYTKSDNWYFEPLMVPATSNKMKGEMKKRDNVFDIPTINNQAKERIGYPTQKPENLLELIIKASSKENDIVLDAFAGSGTTLAVAEKLDRRWIGIDCGKLAIYTIQKRMLNLTTQIGAVKEDKRRDYERVNDLEEHSKNLRGMFFIFEKAKKGDLIITDTFLKNLAKLISENLSGETKEFSFICPKDKFKISELQVQDNEDGKAGEKIVEVDDVKFLISFIQPKEKTEEGKPLKAKEFTLYYAGVYDKEKIFGDKEKEEGLPWEQYKPFVAQLFGVRLQSHKIHAFEVAGYIGIHSVFIWDYPNQKNLILDREYVQTLHNVLDGKAGDKFYVIAPIVSMGFMEDEIKIGNTTYVFLKVPLSVLMALIEKGEPGSLRQPVSNKDINEFIDMIGFDFISQPIVTAEYKREKPLKRNLLNKDERDFVIRITEFRSNTLVYDPEDFENFETFSMVLVDTNYNGKYFNLDKVFWANDGRNVNGVLNKEKTEAMIRIKENDFIGDKMMIIYMDKYGNELRIIKKKEDFK